MEWVKGLWGGNKKMKKKESTTTVAPSLQGRETPIDLLEKGTFRFSHIANAEYCVNPDKNLLTVTLPKTRNKKKTYEMEYYRTLDLLAEAIRKEMEYDQFETMDALRLACEYPYFFWNGMFHCLGRANVFEKEMQERGIQTSGKRRKTKK